MKRKRRYSLIAVAISALSLLMAFRYGVAVWRAYADVLPAQLLLVSLVAVWMTSLAGLWSRAIRVAKQAPRPRRILLRNDHNCKGSPKYKFPVRPLSGNDVTSHKPTYE